MPPLAPRWDRLQDFNTEGTEDHREPLRRRKRATRAEHSFFLRAAPWSPVSSVLKT